MSKTIHQMWLGPFRKPPEYDEYADLWAALNHGWEVRQWSLDELMESVINRDVVEDLFRRDAGREGVELWVQLADVFGYQVIYQHGGIYTNVDIKPVRSVDYLLQHYRVGERAYAPYEDEGELVVNAVLGGPAEHPFWERINAMLPAFYEDRQGAEMNQATGPHLLTALARAWGRNRKPEEGFVALPQRSFNPIHWKQISPGGDAEGWVAAVSDDPDVIGVHMWSHRKYPRTNYVETATQGVRVAALGTHSVSGEHSGRR